LAVVPTLNNNQPTVQQQPMPDYRVQPVAEPDSFGASAAKAVSAVGEDYNQMAVKQKQSADLQAVQQATIGATTEINDYAHNPNDGYLNRTGTDAKGVAQAMGAMNKAVVYKYGQSLTDPVQQQAFINSMNPLIQGYQDAADNHEVTQTKIAQKQIADAAASASQSTVIANYSNPTVADPAFHNELLHQQAYQSSIGTPADVISQSLKSYSTDTVTKMIKTALSVNDIQGAQNVLNHYGYDTSKMDGGTRTELQGVIDKVALPITLQQISDKFMQAYGMDQVKGTAAIKSEYGNDVNVDKILSRYNADMSTARTNKNIADKAYLESTVGNLMKAETLADAQNIINSSNLLPTQKVTLLNQAQAKFKALEKPTPLQAFFDRYERTGFITDTENIRQYNQMQADGKDVSPSQQKSFNDSTVRMTNYDTFMSNGGYNPKSAAGSAEDQQNNAVAIFKSMDDMASKGMTQDEIFSKLDEVAPKYGFDPNYFKGNAEGKWVKKVAN